MHYFIYLIFLQKCNGAIDSFVDCQKAYSISTKKMSTNVESICLLHMVETLDDFIALFENFATITRPIFFLEKSSLNQIIYENNSRCPQ